MHTFAKIYWKTEGRAKSIPIYTPFNQLNLEQPDSYLENVKGKWKQTLRHSYGIHEVSYNVFQFSQSKGNYWKNLSLIYYFIDIMLIHNCFTTPILICYNLHNIFGSQNPIFLSSTSHVPLLNIVALIINFLCLATFEIYKRNSNKKYYKG